MEDIQVLRSSPTDELDVLDKENLKRYLAGLPAAHLFTYNRHSRDSLRQTLNRFTGFTENDLQIDMHDHNHYGRPCGRKFRKGEAIFRCLTCGFDETCALCTYCFQEKNHVGHQVRRGIIQRESNGCCDCGDLEAFSDLRCDLYDIPSGKERLLSTDQVSRFCDTLNTALDYVLDVMTHSFTSILPPKTKYDVVGWSENSSLDPLTYHEEDINTKKYVLLLYNDETHQYRDAVQRIRFTTGKVTEFAEMVAQECNDAGKAIVMISSDIDFLLSKQKTLTSTGLSACIRSTRDVFRELMCDEIIDWLSDLSVSQMVKSSKIIRDSICVSLLSNSNWGCQNSPKLNFSFQNRIIETDIEAYEMSLPATRRVSYRGTQANFRTLRWEIPDDVSRECGYSNESGNYTSNSSLFSNEELSRFKLLAIFDIRFSKTIRNKLHDLYMSLLINNLRYKMMITAQYVDIYVELGTMFLSIDREPEFSLLPIFSPQVFTCPTNCSSIVRHGDLSKMLDMVDSFIRTGSTTMSHVGHNKRGLLYSSLKNRKWAHIFMDMTYIMSRNQDVEAFFQNLPYFNQTLKVLGVFQSKPTIKREVNSHVEYESTDYGLYFNGMSVISHFSDNIGKALNKIDSKATSTYLIRLTIEELVRHVFFEFDTSTDPLDTANKKIIRDQEAAIEFHNFSLNGVTTKIVRFDVMNKKLSLLHPIHSLLSWLIEMSRSLNTVDSVMELNQLANEVGTCFNDTEIQFASTRQIMQGDVMKGIFDIPLRTLVLLSQIKVGLWVRNGMSIRNQMNIYKCSGIREFGYTRDLFLLQLFCGLQSTDVSLTTMIDRWCLRSWCERDFKKTGYPQNHLQEMVEEFILFLIHLLTEDMHLHKRTGSEISDLRIKREIIQTLCFGHSSYGKITSEVSDHLSSEKRFFLIFDQCVDEIIPSTSASGNSSYIKEFKTYKLKEELFAEVNPYYIHYSSNKRDDCMKMLKERASKLSNTPIEDVCIPPKLVKWEDSPFRSLIKITCSIHFISILESTLDYSVQDFTGKSETGPEVMLELILHLIHIAVTLPNANEFIANYLKDSEVPAILFDLLTNESYNIFFPRLRAILSIFCSFFNFENDLITKSIPNFNSSIVKKKNKILAKFRKQQQKFADSLVAENSDLMDIDEDEDEFEDENNGWQFPHEHCILCQMPANSDDEPFGIISYILQSNQFRSVPFENKYWFYKSFSGSNNLDEVETEGVSKVHQYLKTVEKNHVVGPGFPSNELACNENHSVLTSCCHGMHFSCYLDFIKTGKSRQLSQITRTIPEDVSRQEFLCPLCKAVNNVFIPVFYSSNKDSFQEKLKSMSISILDPGLDDILAKDTDNLSLIKSELVANVKSKVKPQYWFIKEEDENDLIQADSKSFQALNHSLSVLALLSLPFDGISAIITKTIESMEISLRGTAYEQGLAPLLIYQLSNQTITSLRVWSQLRELIRCTETVTSTSDKYSKSFLTYPERLLGLLRNICYDDDLLYSGEDYFKLLVGAEEVQSIGLDFSKLIHICYLKHLKQSLMITMIKLQTMNFDTGYCKVDDLQDLEYGSDKLNQIWQTFTGTPCFGGGVMYSMLIKLMTPFLRKCLIYAFVRFPSINGGMLPDLSMFELECDKLCSVMNLPTVNQVLEEMPLSEFANVAIENKHKLNKAKLSYPGRIKLATLPLRLSELFSEYYNNVSKKPYDPAICLFCCSVVDLQTANYGDRIGSCNAHATWECINGGIGMFLIPRNNCILLLNKKKGSFFESPYIDDHGENDEDSKKGHDLHLSIAKYDEFMKVVWLQHNIPNQISRKLESQIDIGGWQTL
ncbi:hypothetical protein CANARDRAFT_28613 [[Candida] arabinofermentans NRRL YB-2248]|uniref:E3 ubiquitin-protein ligase n=1 Tax=[Candida] arabinofermentans NRRL YB-2248 TaxID=983967 RepID=A0A1E4SZE1_9ASCO|nr:hypothetical protein CANARDRAFT_28613 [[Candida] arabinofermentans NRRL YB-2248]